VIIDGNAHTHAGNLARYLLRSKDGERVDLIETRGSATDDLTQTLTDWEAIGRATTGGENILYHSWLRLDKGERLHPAQWAKTIQTLEEKLGLTNCPRAIVTHTSEGGEAHYHVVWSRVDPEQRPLVKLSNSARKSIHVAREAEREFGLRELRPVDTTRKEKLSTPTKKEVRALKDRGASKDRLEKIVQAAWRACDTGQEMIEMLRALKVEIKPGDRRDWVVEYAGVKMNPVRLLEGVNQAQFRERMMDIDLEAERERNKAKERDGANILRRKSADRLVQGQIDGTIANDENNKPAKSGFRLKRHKAPTPRLRPKLWYGDPGI